MFGRMRESSEYQDNLAELREARFVDALPNDWRIIENTLRTPDTIRLLKKLKGEMGWGGKKASIEDVSRELLAIHFFNRNREETRQVSVGPEQSGSGADYEVPTHVFQVLQAEGKDYVSLRAQVSAELDTRKTY
ncbi:MAG: hypothetical protein UR61_C0021G0003 [candidate division WS6 bacterium GW2011_GWE1_34_7]|uniref:Uncharacterized protein n=1 Tax=candidate division WS6 bacterium GW2011_GWE1_34_7 TaxID=1619093 RepID=A0A0G0BP92_9BACT|nr:MAG: hypothetical protein UR61_C0021G0003 [candidate division WS6 bacterium GW2011_GWE1_34_7]